MRNFIFSIACVTSLCFSSQAMAQRPTAPKLFSQKTVLYARVDDTRDLKEKLAQTSMGRLADDPKIKPILSSFYSTFTNSIEGMQQAIGLNMDELLSIPNGELALALIPDKKEPSFCFMIEAGEELPAIELMISRLDANPSVKRTQKQVAKIEITTIKQSEDGNNSFSYFTDQGVLVGCNSPEYAETLAMIWTGNGIDHKSLADNRDFTTIMSRCVGTEGERPQVSFYCNPIGMFRELSKSQSSSVVALTAIRTLGIDGIKALGGSMIFAPSEFDSIIHGHMLLENNRRGVLRAVRPKTGSTEPEAWVGDDVISYATLNWDIAKTLKAIAEIVDTFQGENFFEETIIARGSKEIGIDLRKDFFDLLNDRITIVQTIVPPKRINSQSNLYALHVKEASRINTEVLPNLMKKLQANEKRWKSKLIGDVTVYYIDLADQQSNRDIRIPQPAFGVLGNVILVGDSLEVVEQAIKVESTGDNLLADAIEFKLVRDRIRKQLKDAETSILAYQRPEESLRLFYDLARDPGNITKLEDMATNNPFFTALVGALKNHELPPFETIAKYLAPGGAYVVEEESGLHYTGFSLRRE